MKKIIRVPVKKLQKFIEEVFLKLGVPDKEAKICADILITADRRGIDSHGVGRLKMYYDRLQKGIQLPKTKIKIVKETKTTAVIDGNYGMGQVIAYRAMKFAIKKAKKYGLGAVAVRKSSHFGIAGYYAEMAARENMIGFVVTNARPAVAPIFGVEPMYGTNPIAFACPTDEKYPFLLDMATPIIQRGKIEIYARAKKTIPKGWIIDSKARPYSGNANKILKDLLDGKASLLPLGGKDPMFGGHKGYGLGIMVEILSACLSNANYLKKLSGFDKKGREIPHNLGHFFLAINIRDFIPIGRFKKIVGKIIRGLRSSKKVPGKKRIYIAGEKEYEMMKIRDKKGIPINPVLQKSIKIIENDLGIKLLS